MRNFLWAAVYAQRYKKRQFGVLLICPSAYRTGLEGELEVFKADVLRPEYHGAIRLRTYEEYTFLLRGTGEARAIALATFLEGRIRDLLP